MVTARYLTEKFVEPLRERIKAEARKEGIAEGREEGKAAGIAEGLAQKQREWEVWLRESEDARARGEPFDDPPPSL